jgi:hypothetical protein
MIEVGVEKICASGSPSRSARRTITFLDARGGESVPVEGAAHAQHELDGLGRQLVLAQGRLRVVWGIGCNDNRTRCQREAD